MKNAVTKDYMGKAVCFLKYTNNAIPYRSAFLIQKLVAASDPGDAFTEFTGVTRLKQGISPTGVYIDRPTIDTNLRSATSPASADPRTSPVMWIPLWLCL